CVVSRVNERFRQVVRVVDYPCEGQMSVMPDEVLDDRSPVATRHTATSGVAFPAVGGSHSQLPAFPFSEREPLPGTWSQVRGTRTIIHVYHLFLFTPFGVNSPCNHLFCLRINMLPDTVVGPEYRVVKWQLRTLAFREID